MSDSAIIKDCLVHHTNQHIQLRKDFFSICAYNPEDYNLKQNTKGQTIKDEPNQECMSKIMRLMETLTNDERSAWYRKAMVAREKGLHIANEPAEFPIELTYGAMSKLLYHTHGDSTIRNSVAVLIDRGFIKRSQETINSIPHYVFCVQTVQQALNHLEEEQIMHDGLLKITPRQRRMKKAKVAVENNSQAFEINSQSPAFNSQAFEINTNNITNKKPSKKPSKKEEREQVPPTSPEPEQLGTNVPSTPSLPSLEDSSSESQEDAQTSTPNRLPGFEPPTTNQKEKPARNASQVAKPTMPTNEQVWSAETLVQTLEFHRGSRYPNGAKRKSDRVRETELEAAQTLLKDAADIWTGHTTEENAATLILIVGNLETTWWLEHNGHVLPHQLVDKDRVHVAWHRIKASASSSSSSTPSVDPIDFEKQREAARIKNLATLEKLHQRQAKAREEQERKRAVV